ncbi:MbnP family protein [Thalassotalea sp. Y01]|uniref:MbnP family protein n=1 Tax=Thalassotalea sp. Y01 TaxID=2729613 RepID=UPI00145C8462|nr:MbnP family protein [Thalassotalea sp. Y01]NMP15180.1 hypothetical protein [Thalassotalea sp. Y01]
MTKRASNILLFLTILVVVGGSTWQFFAAKSLTIRFYPYMGDKPLLLNEQIYPNPGGPGQFKIRDLQLFISNVQLQNGQQQYSQKDSYHLLRFDNEQGYFDIVIDDVAVQQFDTLQMGIGVDDTANGSIVFAGDLDPNGRMAWNWQVGYKFLLLEGSLQTEQESIPLVYHIGFDESYTKIQFAMPEANAFSDHIIELKVNVYQLFDQQQPVNMADISTVKFDPDNVKTIAKAFPQLISVKR